MQASERPPAIQLEAVEVLYGFRKALRKIDLIVPEGARVLVVGHNGPGKSTLLRLLATLVQFRQGQARILGFELPRYAHQLRSQLGYLGHEPQLYPTLSALENLHFAARLHGQLLAREQLLQAIENVGLGPVALQACRSFSRGMLQKLALARTLLPNPRLLLLDEPLTGLDSKGRAFVVELLQREGANERTILATTHQVDEILPACTHVLSLGRGQVQWFGPAREWHEHRGSMEVQA